MAFYVVVHFFLPSGQRDPNAEKSGPFGNRQSAEQAAIAAIGRSNVARVEIIESGVADFRST